MKNLLMTLLLVSSTLTFAKGGSAGNGGDAVLVNGKGYMLDLVDLGVEYSPQYGQNPIDPAVLAILKKKFASAPKDFPFNLVASKIADIQAKLPIHSIGVIGAINKYHWSWVNHSLVDQNDDGSVLDVKKNLIQVAVRKDKFIKISRESWKVLADDHQKAALIIHEAVYAISKPFYKKYIDRFTSLYDQSGEAVRSFVGYMYSADFTMGNTNEALAFLSNSLFGDYAEMESYGALSIRKAEINGTIKKSSLAYYAYPAIIINAGHLYNSFNPDQENWEMEFLGEYNTIRKVYFKEDLEKLESDLNSLIENICYFVHDSDSSNGIFTIVFRDDELNVNNMKFSSYQYAEKNGEDLYKSSIYYGFKTRTRTRLYRRKGEMTENNCKNEVQEIFKQYASIFDEYK